MRRAALVALAVLVVGGLGFAVSQHIDRAGKVRDAKRSCAGLDTTATGAALPAGFALPSDQTLLRVQRQGKTSVVLASAEGGRGDLVDIRNRVVAALKGSGYHLKHRDQEPTYEADAALSKGGVEDSINVRPLCSGKAVVRYTLH